MRCRRRRSRIRTAVYCVVTKALAPPKLKEMSATFASAFKSKIVDLLYH